MATPFHLEVVTPERVLFSGETDEVSTRTDGGEIAFLAHHEEFVGAVDITPVRIHLPSDSDATDVELAVHGGFIEVNEAGVVIVAGVAELAGEIDVARAQQALAKAEERLSAGEGAPSHADDESDGTEPVSAMAGAMLALLAPESPEAAARRARVRLEVAGSPATS